MHDVEAADRLSLADNWIYKVAVLADRVARRVARIADEVGGLNLSQWRVLAAVADTPGRTARDVVAVTPMDKAIVSRAVASLAARGLIRREACPRDGRQALLTLTDEGARTYQVIVRALLQSGASGQATGSQADRRALLALLDRFIADYPER